MTLEVRQSEPNEFDEWSTPTLAAQCRMQAREQLDPEYTRFMEAVARRLDVLVNAEPLISPSGMPS